jgi:hypothetical protein
MAATDSNAAANGQTSQVKIHLTSRDENIQLPQDTGAILVATGEYLSINLHIICSWIFYSAVVIPCCWYLFNTDILLQNSSVTSFRHW